MTASDFRRIARDCLRGRWPISIGVTLVAVLLGASQAGMGGGGGRDSSGRETISQLRESLFSGRGFSQVNFVGLFQVLIGLFSIVVVLWAVLRLIVGSSMDLGLKLYNIRLLQGAPQAPFSTLVERFHIFGKALGLRLITLLFVLLWSLLFLIPGIVAAYRYSMAPYLLAQNPEMDVMDALEHSKQMMRGYKGDLFFLHLTFIGWALLSSLAFGLGYLLLNPYRNAAEAAFYLNRIGQLNGGWENAAEY